MKTIKSIAAVALTTLLLVSCKNNDSDKVNDKHETAETVKIKKEIAPENLQTASFEIEGMTCAVGCAKTIEKELADLDGVQEAIVDFETKTATVSFDKTVQTPESLIKVTEETGDGKTYKTSNVKS